MSAPNLRLAELTRCFQGVVPSIIATSDTRGIPNVTYVSQVHFLDESHVALSRQFFNKTSRNLDQNPLACAEVYDPVSMEAYRLRLRFLRTETSGTLFDTMRIRIEAIASHTGMSGVFRLIGADIFEVLDFERIDGFLIGSPPPRIAEVSVNGYPSEMRGLQLISERINLAEDLEGLLSEVLAALEQFFGFEHTMVLLYDEASERLTAVESRGYGGIGAGAEVPLGEGLIGTVALERRVLRIAGIDAGFRYGRAVRREVIHRNDGGPVRPEIPLPGLPDAQSALVIPLSVQRRLIGVLAAESRDPIRFFDWHEAYLEIIGNQIALGIDHMLEDSAAEPAELEGAAEVQSAPAASERRTSAPVRTVMYYGSDDSIFVDGEYLIRNVPGKILWKLLRQWKSEGRTEFTNRELRLDPSLGLPAVKDNLESRLILLRRRLEEKCPDVRMEPSGRGRFALRVDANLEMVER